MNAHYYQYSRVGSEFTYYFTSKGPKGCIPKIVHFVEVSASELGIADFKKLYNLSFGDLRDHGTNAIVDDTVRSNNGDLRVVLSTVIHIVVLFLHKNTDATLLLSGYIDYDHPRGSSDQRSKLYQKVINVNWAELNQNYRFWGLNSDYLERYVVGRQYQKVLIRRKQ